MQPDDETWMRRALELARKADFHTSPNPMVGAVLVSPDGELLGEGFHQRAFQPHAERVALDQAGERARGATLYVTLEPCVHEGRTPPCSAAVRAAKVSRVVTAMVDPNPQVNGRGVDELREAGIAVEVGLCEEEAQRLNDFYLKWITTKLPFVTLKFAMSLDGKIATASGESKWISGEESRAYAHELRHEHDAIVVGINTVLADDPELTTRWGDGERRHPLRVVLDSNLRTPAGAHLVDPALPGRTLIVGQEGAPAGRSAALTAAGAEVLLLPECAGKVDVRRLVEVLGKREIISVLVEGGGEVHASFLAAGIVDRIDAVIAPLVIGGRESPTPVGGGGFGSLREAPKLRDLELRRLGDDVLVSGRVHRNR